MLETLKKWGTDLTLKVKDLFTSPESKVYVKDLRKVMTYNGKKCQYPKNYDQIVESGEIIEKKDRNGKLVKDEEGNPEYQLKYNGYKFDLALVKKVDNRSYFTIDFLVNPKKNKDVKHYDSYYKPFEFSKIDLEKHLPVFEAQNTENSKYPFELTNPSVLAKKGCSINDKTGEVNEEDRDEKGRNGELLYTSDYKKLSTSFSEIRDQNGNLELDKSLISVPIVLAAGLAKICTKLLTFIPMKLGEHLVNRQNPIAKFFGYLLFTPAMAVKNLVNMGATVLKAPILLFVADKKKYGDAYFTMWKHQLKECWKETKNDYSVVKEGKRVEPEKEDYLDRDTICGTWKELDARRPGIEKELEEGLNKSSESANKPREPEKSKEKSQNASNEQMANKHQENSNTHTGKITKGRQTADANTLSR
ncbi:MAG: hypothetical protein LBU02_04390 [Rickettsiales bacterium]|jgi:hypothetical protein|nr:hypothetical protein [Rickettsiales bacterium]